MAQLAHFYFTKDTCYDVVAFTVDREFRDIDTLYGLPVIDFETVAEAYPPSSCQMFVALAYSKVNSVRREKYEKAKLLGYNLVSYVSPKSTVLSESAIGDNCFIFEDNTIQPFVRIGSNVTMWSGNHVGHHSVIEDHVFIASHVVVSGHVVVGEQCFLGVNATIRDHLTIGSRCVVGAGTLILSDAEPDGLYIGSATPRSNRPSSTLRKI